ncbi:MAG: hypothetical protein V7727_13745 [Sneathiella sp.]
MAYVALLLPLWVAGDLFFRNVTLNSFGFLLWDLELAILGAAALPAFLIFLISNKKKRN